MELPISDDIFDEAVGRVFEYTMHPKREAGQGIGRVNANLERR